MSTDVVALASVITSGLVGLAGLGATAWTSKRARDHSKELADTDRQQERLLTAYLALLGAMRKTGRWAQNVKPTFDPDPSRDAPERPDGDEWHRVLAMLDAYGSVEVQNLHAEWVKTVDEVGRAALDLEFRSAHKDDLPHKLDGESSTDVYRRLDEELRPAEREARKAVADRIANELKP